VKESGDQVEQRAELVADGRSAGRGGVGSGEIAAGKSDFAVSREPLSVNAGMNGRTSAVPASPSS